MEIIITLNAKLQNHISQSKNDMHNLEGKIGSGGGIGVGNSLSKYAP